jgi:hypothetical protein
VKNASKALRDAYYSALQAITYNGKAVPCYKGTPVQTVPDHYIVIGSITEANEASDALFIRPTEITLDIITRQYKYKNTDVADAISESITQAVLPSVGSTLANSDFQIGHIEQSNSLYLDGTDGEYYITRKILSFTQTLIQK